MLESKYLTQDGIKLVLQHIYDKGFKYLYYDTDDASFIASQQKPVFENNDFQYCMGLKKIFADGFSTEVLNDLLCGHNYIDIAEQLEIVDWENVPVDTLVQVKTSSGKWKLRYFAKYVNGNVFVFANGATSVTAEDNVWQFSEAKLVK